jgi:hypothetical protein
VFNRIQTLLGQAERLEASGEPWRAAQIKADVNAFITEEERRLEQSKGETGKSADEWRSLIGGARREYKKADKGVLSDALSLGGMTNFLPTPF